MLGEPIDRGAVNAAAVGELVDCAVGYSGRSRYGTERRRRQNEATQVIGYGWYGCHVGSISRTRYGVKRCSHSLLLLPLCLVLALGGRDSLAASDSERPIPFGLLLGEFFRLVTGTTFCGSELGPGRMAKCWINYQPVARGTAFADVALIASNKEHAVQSACRVPARAGRDLLGKAPVSITMDGRDSS